MRGLGQDSSVAETPAEDLLISMTKRAELAAATKERNAVVHVPEIVRYETVNLNLVLA